MLRAAGSRVDLRAASGNSHKLFLHREANLSAAVVTHPPPPPQTCQADPGYIPGTRPAGRARRTPIAEVLDKYYTSVRGGDGGMIA